MRGAKPTLRDWVNCKEQVLWHLLNSSTEVVKPDLGNWVNCKLLVFSYGRNTDQGETGLGELG